MARRELAVNITGDATSLQRALERSEKKVADLETRLRSSRRGFDEHAKGSDRAERSLDKLNVALGNSTHQTKVFSGMVENIKFPALVTGAGLAAQALSSLAAGGVAVGSSLAPLAGALAAYPALGSAAAQGMGVFKLATANVFEAVGGLNERLDKNAKAFKELDPQAQKLAVTLDKMKAPLRDLQTAAQRGLFPGLTEGIKDAERNLPVFQTIVRDTAVAMGDFARRAGEMLGSRAWGRDFQTQGERNVRWLERGGNIALRFADVLRNVTLAAGPMVNWMTLAAERGARVVDTFVAQQRASGGLTRFFHETQIVMSRVARIGGDLAVAFFNIAKAGKPLGDEILVNLVKSAEAFKDWTNSASGRNSIQEYFRQARPAIFELGRLIKDAGKAFFQLGRGDQVAPLLRQIRTQLLPVFTRVIDSTTKQFGPALINAATSVLKLFGQLAGSNGPLVQTVKLIGHLAESLNWIIEHVPGVGTALVTLAGLGGLAKALRITAAVTGVKSLIDMLKTARTLQPGVAPQVAPQVPVGGQQPGRQQPGRGRLPGVLPLVGNLAISAAVLGGWQVLQGVIETNRKKASQFADGLKLADAQARKFASERNVSAIRRLADSVQDFGRKTGASTDDIRKAQAGLNRYADGIERWRNRVRTVNRQVGDSFGVMRTVTEGHLSDIRRFTARNSSDIAKTLGKNTDEGRAALSRNFRLAAREVQKSMDAGVISTKTGTSEIRDLMIRGLQALGLTRDQARAKITNGTLQLSSERTPGGGGGRRQARGGWAGRESGGWIGQRGERGGDNIPIVVGAGEAVLNRHQQAVVEGLLGDGFLDRLFSTVQTPHYLAKGGIVGKARKFASGGIVALGRRLQRMGYAVSENPAFGGVHPVHVRGSLHYSGNALDVNADSFPGGEAAALDRLAGMLKSQGWHVLWRVPGHFDHLHVDTASGGGAIGGALVAPKIRVGRVGGGGAVQAMVQRGLALSASAANAVMQRAADSMMFSGDVGGPPGRGSYGKAQLMALWQQAGGPANVANIAAAIALAESGGNPNARNSIGATGLWQIYNGPGTSLGLKNPMANARAAVAKWRAAGGFTPWTTYTGADTPGHQRTYLRYLARGGFIGRAARAARGKPPHARVLGHQPITLGGRKPPSISPTQLQRGLGYLDVQMARAEGTKSLEDDRRVMRRQRSLQQQRLQWVQFNLRNAVLAPATRADLRTEQAQLIRDIRDLDKTISDPFLGQGAPDVPTTTDVIAGDIGRIDLLERAGQLTSDQATGQRAAIRQNALAGRYGALTTDERLGIMGDLRDALQANTDAQQAQQAALEAHTQALTDVTAELKRQSDFADSVANTSNYQLTKSLADILSGQIVGYGVAGRAATPGAGVEVAY